MYPRLDAPDERARVAAIVRYARQLNEIDRLGEEAASRDVLPAHVWFCAAGMTLAEVGRLLDRARAAELLDPTP